MINNALSDSSKICYAERPWRRAPEAISADHDIYQASSDERAQVVAAALDAGVTVFHATHERETMSLGLSLQTLDVRKQIVLSTTDGDVLERCPDTEAGAFEAIQRAIVRKCELLRVEQIDVLHLYDVRRTTHTPARIAGAMRALAAARDAGEIRQIGATCYGDYTHLAEMIAAGEFMPDSIAARFNFLDTQAAARLFPVCREHTIRVLAAQTFGWIGGVSFMRFPNTWRLRNLTKNFTGVSAGQIHLRWVLAQDIIDGALVSMQSAEQIRENVAAAALRSVPPGTDTLFQSFAEALLATREGWTELLGDAQWEVRAAAEAYLSAGVIG